MQITISGVAGVNRDLDTTLAKFVSDLGKEVLVNAKANTPVRSGNARRNWSKTDTKSGFRVTNNVPYIERLEAGASRQAPKGILGPTLTQVKGKYK
jgi:HK97 gp10 family phage protein